MPLIEDVRQALKGTEMSMAEIARIAGINRVTLHKFRSGETGLSADVLEKVAAAMGFKFKLTGRAKKKS